MNRRRFIKSLAIASITPIVVSKTVAKVKKPLTTDPLSTIQLQIVLDRQIRCSAYTHCYNCPLYASRERSINEVAKCFLEHLSKEEKLKLQMLANLECLPTTCNNKTWKEV